MMKRTISSLAGIVLMAGMVGAQTNDAGGGGATLFSMENLSFAQGLQNWSGDYDTNAYPQTPLTVASDATLGANAMRLAATNGQVKVHQDISAKSYPQKETWNFTYDMKLSNPEDIDRFCVHLDYSRVISEGLGALPYPYTVGLQKLDNGWMRATVRLHLSGDYQKLRVGFQADADVAVANLRLDRQTNMTADTMYFIDPFQITISRALEPKLAVELFYNKDLIRRAMIYNQFIADMGFAREKTVKLNRMSFYLGLDPDPGLNGKMDEVEKGVADLYDVYAKAYFEERFMHRGICPMLSEKSKMILALEFDPLARKITDSFKAFQDLADKQAEDLHAKARKSGLKWSPPPKVESKPFCIREDGRPNRILMPEWDQCDGAVERCRALRMGNAYCLEGTGYGKVVLPDGQIIFSELDAQLAYLKSHNYEYFALHTPVAGLGLQLGSEFYDKHKDNPDMFLKHRTSGVMSNAHWYNWWQPEVRAQVDKVIKSFCAGIQDRDEVLMLAKDGEIANWDLGYDRPAAADFQKYLEKKYGTIEKLNGLWNTKHASFTEIEPQPQKYESGKGPLEIESSEWLDQAFVDWLKFHYDTLKKYAPNKLVLSQHNQFAYSVDPAPYFATVDVLCHHSSADAFLAACQTVRSMNRFEKKILGQFEPAICQAGRFKKRYGNERAVGAGNAMDTYRKTVRGMLLQAKSGPYSTAYYAPAYMGNIWLDMVLNMTVIRYAALGMSVAVDNVKALEPVFLDSDKVVSKVLLIHGLTRVPMQAMYEFLTGSDYDYECLSVSYIARGVERLENYDVVLMPLAQSRDEKISPYLQKYVENGGVLVCLNGSALVDRYGKPLEGKMLVEMRKLFAGGKQATRIEKNETAVVEPTFAAETQVEYLELKEKDIAGFSFGKGQVFVVRGNLFMPQNKNLRKSLLDILAAHTQRNAYSRNNSYELTLLQHIKDRNKFYLCAINPSADVARTDEIFVRGKYKMVSDINVPGGMAVPVTFTEGYTSFRTRLEPGGFAVIEMDKVE